MDSNHVSKEVANLRQKFTNIMHEMSINPYPVEDLTCSVRQLTKQAQSLQNNPNLTTDEKNFLGTLKSCAEKSDNQLYYYLHDVVERIRYSRLSENQ